VKAICVTLMKLALAFLLTYVIIVYMLGLFPAVSVTKLLGS